MKKLSELNEEQYLKLKEAGMLWEVYPEASGSYLKDTLPEYKFIDINHAGVRISVRLNNKFQYVIPEETMEMLLEKVGDFDCEVLSHILQRLQEANVGD